MEAISEAMEDLVAAVRELALSVSSVKTTVDESHSLLRKIGAGKPHVDGAFQEMRSDNTTPQPPLGRVALNPILGLDPSTPQVHATPAAMEGGVSAVVEFGSSSIIGGQEALASSLPSVDSATETGGRGALACRQPMATRSTRLAYPWSSYSVSTLDAKHVEDSSDRNISMPTKCSTLGFRPSAGSLETSVQPGIVFTTSPGHVEASPYSTMHQLGILRPDKVTLTTCLTDVLSIDTDAIAAKRDTDILLASLATNPDAAAAFPATTRLQPLDQPGLLLARPPPWPAWMASFIHSSTRRCAWLLLMLTVPPKSSSTTIMCVPVVAPSTTSLTIRFVTMKWDPGPPGDELPAGDSLGTSSFYKHKHAYAQLDGKCTQLDLIEQRSCIHYKLQMDRGMFEILDGLLATLACDYVAHGFCTWALHRDHPGKHQRVQPHYIAYILYARTLCRLANYHLIQLWSLVIWSITITDPGILQHIKCQALWPKNCFGCEKNGSNFPRMSCWVLHVWMLANQTSEFQCTCQTVLQQFLQKLGELCEPTIIFPRCSSFSGIGMTAACLVFVHLTHLSAAVHSTTKRMLADLGAAGGICEIPLPRTSPDFVYFCDDLVMLSVSNLRCWDPGINSQLIRVVVLPESVQQALRGTQITPGDSLADRQCTWALYWNHLGTHLGTRHKCSTYNFLGDTLLAGVVCKSNGHCLILEGALIHEFNPLIARKTAIGNYAQYKRVGHLAELLIEISDPREGFPQVHPVNDNRALFIFALVRGPNHSDQVGCEDSLLFTLLWDPVKLLCLEFWFTHPTDKQLRESSSDKQFRESSSDKQLRQSCSNKLHRVTAYVHRLWDPGGSSRRPAWGQAGFQGGANVTNWIVRWAAVDFGLVIGPKLMACSYKMQELEERRGDEEITGTYLSSL